MLLSHEDYYCIKDNFTAAVTHVGINDCNEIVYSEPQVSSM